MTVEPELDPPRVSVVVPVYNEAARLRDCLAALAVQTYPADRYEVLVVDNASTEDLSAAVPEDPRFRLLHEARRGSYAARNTGLEVASGEVLAFTDGDCVPDPSWLEEAVRALAGPPRADMVGGAVELFFRSGRPSTGAEVYEDLHAFPQQRYLEQDRFAVTANMVTWRSVVDRVGPFDARLLSRGDAEFGARVAAAGGVQRYAPRAVVRHPSRSTRGEFLSKARRVAVGRCDADLHTGHGPRHFLGLAARQLHIAVRATAAAVLLRRSGHGPVLTARYLGVTYAARWAQVAVYLGAALRARRARAA